MNVLYNSFKAEVMKGTFNLHTAGDEIRAVLVTSSYTPDQDTHTQYSHITNQVTGTGYTAGGKALTGQTVTQDNTADQGVFDADNVEWDSSSITARGLILYKYVDDDGSPDDTSPLIGFWDFTTDQTSEDGMFEVQWHADGILLLGDAA